MEHGQIGTAWETNPGDWILVRSRNPGQKAESSRIEPGFHFFDVVASLGRSKQPNNPSIRVCFHGSIAGNTTVKKVGSETEH